MCHQQHWRRGCVSTGTLCPVPWGHTGVLLQLFMKAHVAPENLNGGLNNQTSASIVFDRPPPTLPFGVWHVAVKLPLQWWFKRLRYDCCHSTPRCPTPSCDWGCTVTYTHSPSSIMHSLPPLLARLDAGMPCLTPSEKMSWAFTALWCVNEGVFCACMWVYCAAFCVYCSRAQHDSLSQWRAPV